MMKITRRYWICGVSLSAVGSTTGCQPEPSGVPLSSRNSSGKSGATSAPAPARSPEDASVSPPTEPAREPTSAPASLAKIYIMPLGEELPSSDVAFVVLALSVFFPHPVVTGDAVPLPRTAFYPARSRYRAEKLLDHLESLTREDAQVVMGLTDVDISTTKDQYEDWGILGLATLGGRQCVISRFRAKRGADDAHHTRIRLAKVVVHEVGHTLGLEHCENEGCLMEDGKGTVKTTDREFDFCDACRAAVGDAVRPRNVGVIPWPRPS